jgi:hypothetical protein
MKLAVTTMQQALQNISFCLKMEPVYEMFYDGS